MKVIHQYKNNGYNIVLDVNSGSVHVVDDVVYDVIPLFQDYTKEQIVEQLQQNADYSEELILEAIDEVAQLKEQELLFTEDIYKQYIVDFKKRKTLKSSPIERVEPFSALSGASSISS